MRERLRKALEQASLVPMREYKQNETAVLLGAVGLELCAVYSKLVQLEAEFRHAREYLDSGRRADVEETMQINGAIFANMKCKFEKRSKELTEIGKEDAEFCGPASAFLQALAEEAKCLENYRLGADAAESVNGYLERMRGIIEAVREYLGLCIGNTMVWEKKQTEGKG